MVHRKCEVKSAVVVAVVVCWFFLFTGRNGEWKWKKRENLQQKHLRRLQIPLPIWMLPASKQQELQLTCPSTSENMPFIIYKLFTKICASFWHSFRIKITKWEWGEKNAVLWLFTVLSAENLRFIKCLAYIKLYTQAHRNCVYCIVLWNHNKEPTNLWYYLAYVEYTEYWVKFVKCGSSRIEMNRTEVHARISFWFAFDPFLTNYIHKLIRQTVYNFMRWARCFQKGRHVTTQMFVCLFVKLDVEVVVAVLFFSAYWHIPHSRISWTENAQETEFSPFNLLYVLVYIVYLDSFTLQTILNSLTVRLPLREASQGSIYLFLHGIYLYLLLLFPTLCKRALWLNLIKQNSIKACAPCYRIDIYENIC